MLAKLKKLQLVFLEWFTSKFYSEEELVQFQKEIDARDSEKNKMNTQVPPNLANGTIVFHASDAHALPPHIKEQIFAKMGFPPEVAQAYTAPLPPQQPQQRKTFSQVDSQDMIILNNLGHWLSSTGQEGVTDEGQPIMRSTLDDNSRKKANDIFVKMLNRIDKHIELKNNGTI